MLVEKELEREYIIKFYSSNKLMYESTVYALNSKDAVSIALDSVKGVYSFDKIRVIHTND
jgi:hypothetical protein